MLQKAGVRIGTGPHALHRGRVMGNGDLNSWQACALRVLFKPSRALARGECQAIREQYTSPRAEGPSLGTEEVPHRMNAFPSALTPEGVPAWRPLLALHLRSEGRHASNADAWRGTIAAAVVCARVVEERLLTALASFKERRCKFLTKGEAPASLVRACADAMMLLGIDENATASASFETAPPFIPKYRHLPHRAPVWLVLADQQYLVEQVRLLAPDRVTALDSAVRVHSGLEIGGEGRVMGSAFGPLTDLLLAGRALGLVGTAGSSFSQLAASIAMEPPPPWARILVRTPFIKSHQGEGLDVNQALNFCTKSSVPAGAARTPRSAWPTRETAKSSPWGFTALVSNSGASKRALESHVERALLAPSFSFSSQYPRCGDGDGI
jgi:hypothetical protein